MRYILRGSENGNPPNSNNLSVGLFGLTESLKQKDSFLNEDKQMLNKNLIKKSIATAVAGAFVLSATAFAKGATATIAKPATATKGTTVETAKPGQASGVKAPAIQGSSAVVGKAATATKGIETKGAVESKGQQKAGEIPAPAVDTSGIGGAASSVSGSKSGTGQAAKASEAPRASQADSIAQKLANLNASNVLRQGTIEGLSSLDSKLSADVTLIVGALQKAVANGSLTKAEANAFAAAEVINAQAFGQTIVNASMVTEVECSQVFEKREAALNLQKFVVSVAKKLKATGAKDEDAKQIYADVGAEVLGHLNADTNQLLAKLAGVGSACRMNNQGPAEVAIRASQQQAAAQ